MAGEFPWEDSEAALLRSALAGERTAQQELLRLLGPVVHSRALRALYPYRSRPGFTRLCSQVEDLVQEGLTFLVRNDWHVLRTWRPEGGRNLRNYVGFTVARQLREVLDGWIRPHERERPLAPGDPEPLEPLDTEEQLGRRQRLRTLADQLEEQLGPEEYRLFTALFVDEESPEELGRRLGLSRDAIYQRKHRYRQLVSRLEQNLSDTTRTLPTRKRP